MNPHRKKITALLQDETINTIIIENRERLARMNADLIIAASPKNIIVMNEVEPEENDVQDIVDFLYSMCARRYRKRSAKNRAVRKAKELMENEQVL